MADSSAAVQDSGKDKPVGGAAAPSAGQGTADFAIPDDGLLVDEHGAIVAPDAAGAAAGDADQAHDGDHEDDHPAEDARGGEGRPREDRRAKRQADKQRRREARDRTMDELRSTKERADRLEAELGEIRKRQNGTDLAQLDGAINATQQKHDAAKAARGAAFKAGDDAAFETADEQLADARLALQNLRAIKQRVTSGQGATPGRAPDPAAAAVKGHYERWVADKPWFDVAANTRDRRSALVQAIDRDVHADGFQPNTREYWQELDRRIEDDPILGQLMDDDEPAPRRGATNGTRTEQRPANGSAARGGPPVSGSGREVTSASGANVWRLSRERAEALREAGISPGSDAWKRNIANYKSVDAAKQREAR